MALRGLHQLVQILKEEEDLVKLTSLSSYSIVFQQWCELVLPLSLSDFEKVRELGHLANRPLRANLSGIDRRLLFAILRDLPLRWVARVTGSDESPDTMQLVRAATKSILTYAVPDRHKPSDTPRGATAIVLDPTEAQALSKQLPFIIGGLLGGSIAVMESMSASRLTAFGFQLDKQVPPFPSTERMLKERLLVEEPPRIRIIKDDALQSDMLSLLRRRELQGTSSLAGLQVAFDLKGEFENDRWWSLGIPSVHGHWPATHDLCLHGQSEGLLHTSYVVQPVGLSPITREAAIFESRFSDLLNVTYSEVEWFTEGLFRLIALQSGAYAVSESVEIGEHHTRDYADPARLLDDPSTFFKNAHEVWNRGAVRNSRAWFIEMIFGILEGKYERQDIERLIITFTAKDDLRDWLPPFVFYEMTEETLVLDLFEFVDFHERVLRVVSTTIPGKGDLRGNIFEERCTSRILDGIGLELNDPRVIRSFPMKFRDRNYGDVDLAIVSGDTLFNIDMKSRQKDYKYFLGGPDVVKSRQESLVRSLEDKVTARGEKLASLLTDSAQAKSRGLVPANIAKTFSFLCVAGPEFMSHTRPSLWYGTIPRVATPSELVNMILNPRQVSDKV